MSMPRVGAGMTEALALLIQSAHAEQAINVVAPLLHGPWGGCGARRVAQQLSGR
jgi:hypothetical protein